MWILPGLGPFFYEYFRPRALQHQNSDRQLGLLQIRIAPQELSNWLTDSLNIFLVSRQLAGATSRQTISRQAAWAAANTYCSARNTTIPSFSNSPFLVFFNSASSTENRSSACSQWYKEQSRPGRIDAAELIVPLFRRLRDLLRIVETGRNRCSTVMYSWTFRDRCG